MTAQQKLLEKSFKQAEYSFPQYHARLPAGTAIESLKDPAFWANVAKTADVPGIIHATPEDVAYYARLMIRSKGPNWLHVAIIEYVEFETAESVLNKASKEFEVGWGGPAQKFRVIRSADKAILAKDFATKEAAVEWAAANAKAFSA